VGQEVKETILIILGAMKMMDFLSPQMTIKSVSTVAHGE
jgi:hypothetical protein